jgi:preprotein translocase subunit SecF
MSALGRLGHRLYTGEVSIDFVGRRKIWYSIAAVAIVISVAALVLRPLHFGIEFEGGVEFRAKVEDPTRAVPALQEAVAATGLEDNPVVTRSGDGVRVQTEAMPAAGVATVSRALEDAGASSVSSEYVGPSWGRAVAERALLGLAVFLVLVVLFIGLYFREWKMSVAAVAALAHDVLITVGVYALAGFEVTPATVTGLLTILGYSLYDTVVVFDKVRENTRGAARSARRSYAESANLAVNQTLVRSINTSIAALLPVAAILYVGRTRLGSGPLEDLALALFVGIAAGTYSSVFLATPMLVQLKEREPAVREQARRVASRRATAAPAMVGEPAAPAPSGSRAAARREMSTSSARRSQPHRTSRARRGKGRR